MMGESQLGQPETPKKDESSEKVTYIQGKRTTVLTGKIGVAGSSLSKNPKTPINDIRQNPSNRRSQSELGGLGVHLQNGTH